MANKGGKQQERRNDVTETPTYRAQRHKSSDRRGGGERGTDGMGALDRFDFGWLALGEPEFDEAFTSDRARERAISAGTRTTEATRQKGSVAEKGGWKGWAASKRQVNGPAGRWDGGESGGGGGGGGRPGVSIKYSGETGGRARKSDGSSCSPD